MFTSKNITPKQLAIFLAFAISFSCGILIFIFTEKIKLALLGLITIYAISYLSIDYAINQFIYRKIKLIYKFISQTKATQREEFYANEILPQKTLENVNEDVEKWAIESKQEIERLQSNEAFRREFLMNLAHELKTPIFSAQGFIETLLDGAKDNPAIAQSFLEKAAKSIDRLSDLVKDVDQISKLESNEFPLVKSNFFMQDLVRDVFDELSQQAKEKGISLSIKKGCEIPIAVYADKMRIKQVATNLIINSITYGKLQGETTAGVYHVDGRHILIEITDNGIGIAEDRVNRVFERFYRTDQARSRNAGGTGLGLAIVKHIIEAHGHSVTCRSKLDVGTSFAFTLDTA